MNNTGKELVVRASSETLIAPDWVLNREICNDLNQDARLVKDVVKTLKKRIQHKNPKVQILALSLLESLMQNCGEVVHAYVAERELLKEMVKIARKKPDLRVKQKILLLIGAWQEIFEGPLGKYPQYYAAYQDCLNAGFLFPEKQDASKALVVHPLYQQTLPSQNQPASEHADQPAMSLSEFKGALDVMDVLSAMLNDLGPGNKEGLNQDVVINLVRQCRANKERVVKLLNSTTDQYVISKAAALKSDLEKVLAYHEALSAESVAPEKSPMPSKQDDDSIEQESSNDADSSRSVEITRKDDKLPTQQPASPDPSPESNAAPPAPVKAEEPLIDLLSGDDFFQPKPDTNALAIVIYEPNHTSSNQQVSDLTDMFADLLSDNPNDSHRLSSNTSQNPTMSQSVQPIVHASRNLPEQHLPDTMPWHVEPTVHSSRNMTDQHLLGTMPWHVEPTVHSNRNVTDQHRSETLPLHGVPTVDSNRNVTDHHLPGNMPWHVEPTVLSNRNVTDQHLLGNMPLHVEPTVNSNRNSPDQHLSKNMPQHVEPIVHANRINSPDQPQPETMTWHAEPTFYASGGNHNSMAWASYDTKFQINNGSNQWNNVIGTNDHDESLPPPPWEVESTDISPLENNQMSFQTTYPTQQLQPYPTQQPQPHLTQQAQPYPTQQPQGHLTQQSKQYPAQQPQLYPTQQPQPYPTQQPQLYPTQQPQLYPTQQPQQKQDKKHGFLTMMSQQMTIGQDRSLPAVETPTYSPYSQMQNASLTNQEAMYANQIDPRYNHNMYTYGYGNSYGALNQGTPSLYNSKMPTSTMQQQQQPNKFQNVWNGGTFY